MPGFDKTGPAGQGPKTGRGLGKCNPKNVTVNEQQPEEKPGHGTTNGRGPGKGQGRGQKWGAGRGQRWGPGKGRGKGQGNKFRGGDR